MTNRWLLALAGVVALAAACEDGDGAPDVGGDARPLDLAGVYTCSIETIDGYSYCGGPVYTTDLDGAALTMTLTQTGTALEAGMWGKTLIGALQSDGAVSLLYRDTTCTYCSPNRPFIIELSGNGAPGQISNIFIRMHQSSIDECEKTYRGVCAAN